MLLVLGRCVILKSIYEVIIYLRQGLCMQYNDFTTATMTPVTKKNIHKYSLKFRVRRYQLIL